MAYIYQADIFCDACGESICRQLTEEGKAPEDPDDERTYDSDDYPKHASDDDETDCPQHCGGLEECINAEELPDGSKIGCLIGTNLTSDGLEYLKEALRGERGLCIEFWRKAFSKAGYTGLDRFSLFKEEILPEVTKLLESLVKDIGDEYRASEDPEDDTPAMRITIACKDDLAGWSYQTGDNSFTGGCYGSPYWGVGTLTRDSDCKELAEKLIEDMLEQIEEEAFGIE